MMVFGRVFIPMHIQAIPNSAFPLLAAIVEC